jgi:ribosome-associated heat shock protein Hsp15
MAKSAPEQQAEEKLRLDKWLWAARFYKTRSLAAAAVEGGKVLVNADRAKPAKALKVGDELVVRAGWSEYTVAVKAMSGKRGPASEAAKLYEETQASREKREHQAALRRANPLPTFSFKGRPTKRDRRQMEKLAEPEDD